MNRDFTADEPNRKWAGDISCVRTREERLYLAAILDLHSRRVIGWAVSIRMKRDLSIRALNMAIALRQPPRGCIHHTDRGSQYSSLDYQKLLHQTGFRVSMSGKGNCYDNSAVETFFDTIKAELIRRRSWQTRRDAEMAIRIHQWLLQSTTAARSPRLEKPCRIRAKSGLNEHLGWPKNGTGPPGLRIIRELNRINRPERLQSRTCSNTRALLQPEARAHEQRHVVARWFGLRQQKLNQAGVRETMGASIPTELSALLIDCSGSPILGSDLVIASKECMVDI